MTDNELRDLLEQNQRTISETTSLLKRLPELSVASPTIKNKSATSSWPTSS